MKSSADLEFEIDNPEQVYAALLPEADDDLHRSRVRLECSRKSVRLQIDGDDPVSLRAALNTWLRLVKISVEMVNI